VTEEPTVTLLVLSVKGRVKTRQITPCRFQTSSCSMTPAHATRRLGGLGFRTL
jgi:hypothetical protein